MYVLAFVPVLLLLLAAFFFLAFPGPARAARARVVQARRQPPAPPEQGDALAPDPDAAALRASLDGPPSAGESCDRCATTAAAAVYLPSGRLLLCGHHGRQHQAALRTRGALIVGELSFPDRGAERNARRPA